MGEPACGRTQVVDVAAGVGNERVFTGQSFFARVVGFAVHDGLRAVVGARWLAWRWCAWLVPATSTTSSFILPARQPLGQVFGGG